MSGQTAAPGLFLPSSLWKNSGFEGYLHDFGQIIQFSESELSTCKEEKVTSPALWEQWQLSDILSKKWSV